MKHAGRICAMAEGGEIAVLAQAVEAVDAEFLPILARRPEDYAGSVILVPEQ